jgi:Spy/CpxP family protein refolding chaperone
MKRLTITATAIAASLFAVLATAGMFEWEHETDEGPDVLMMGTGPHAIADAFGGPMLHDPMHLVMLSERLKLTPEQRAQVGRILDAAMPGQRELAFRMADTRRELNAARDADPSDKELRRLADQQGKLTADLLYQQMKLRADLRALLTPEQREIARNLFRGGHAFRHGFTRAIGPGAFFEMPVPPPPPEPSAR